MTRFLRFDSTNMFLFVEELRCVGFKQWRGLFAILAINANIGWTSSQARKNVFFMCHLQLQSSAVSAQLPHAFCFMLNFSV